jgi:hypothetical protein
MLRGKRLPAVSLSISFELTAKLALAQEVFITKEEAIASLVEDTYVSPLTGLPVIE